MALAIGSGVPPQYGLYTSAVAGIVIALSGGSRFSVSGPTAAFVVILYPVSQQFGLSGLLLATLMSGVFLLLLMGLAMLAGGIKLVTLGGSWYYLLAGIGFGLSGARRLSTACRPCPGRTRNPVPMWPAPP